MNESINQNICTHTQAHEHCIVSHYISQQQQHQSLPHTKTIFHRRASNFLYFSPAHRFSYLRYYYKSTGFIVFLFKEKSFKYLLCSFSLPNALQTVCVRVVIVVVFLIQSFEICIKNKYGKSHCLHFGNVRMCSPF